MTLTKQKTRNKKCSNWDVNYIFRKHKNCLRNEWPCVTNRASQRKRPLPVEVFDDLFAKLKHQLLAILVGLILLFVELLEEALSSRVAHAARHLFVVHFLVGFAIFLRAPQRRHLIRLDYFKDALLFVEPLYYGRIVVVAVEEIATKLPHMRTSLYFKIKFYCMRR